MPQRDFRRATGPALRHRHTVQALLQVGLGLLAAALLVLALPVELRFQFQGIQPLQGQITLRALFGLWRLRLALPSPKREGPRSTAQALDEQAERPVRHRSGRSVHLQALWRDMGLRRRALRRLQTALGSLHWSDLRLHLRLGLDDPADTGRLWALLGPVGAALSSLRTAEIAIEPDFVEPTLDFDAQGCLVLVPLQVIWPLAVLAGDFGLAVARQHTAGAHRLT